MMAALPQMLLLSNRAERGADSCFKTAHLDAFSSYTDFVVLELPIVGRIPARLDLDRFDLIVAHFTLQPGDPFSRFLSRSVLERLGASRGLKAIFVQDEYQNVLDLHDKLRLGRFDILWTLVPTPEIEKVYPADALAGLRSVTTLAGFVPENILAAEKPPIRARPVVVGYRGRRMPFWLGALSQEKVSIAERFLALSRGSGLVCDISCEEADRIYGRRWQRFLFSCKATLGVESGASVFDFSGELRRNVESYIARHPEASFAEVQRRFLVGLEDKINLRTISPRMFEAAAAKTAMVLFAGEYQGVLKPWRHYIPLQKDFGEVLRCLRDDAMLQEMADRSYEEIALNPAYSHRTFIAGFTAVIREEWQRRGRDPVVAPYTYREFRRTLMFSAEYWPLRFQSRLLQNIFMRTPLRGKLIRVWKRIPLAMRERLRKFIRVLGV
jgi:hypothetical protein